MKKFYLISLMVITLVALSCNAQTNLNSASKGSEDADVDVYYFHMTTRCVTCKAVEAEARKNIEILYADQLKTGKISFTALNLEEAAGKAIGDKLGVNSQTLLIVKGDQKINITNERFLYAVSQPQKFTEIIKSKIDPLIK